MMPRKRLVRTPAHQGPSEQITFTTPYGDFTVTKGPGHQASVTTNAWQAVADVSASYNQALNGVQQFLCNLYTSGAIGSFDDEAAVGTALRQTMQMLAQDYDLEDRFPKQP